MWVANQALIERCIEFDSDINTYSSGMMSVVQIEFKLLVVAVRVISLRAWELQLQEVACQPASGGPVAAPGVLLSITTS